MNKYKYKLIITTRGINKYEEFPFVTLEEVKVFKNMCIHAYIQIMNLSTSDIENKVHYISESQTLVDDTLFTIKEISDLKENIQYAIIFYGEYICKGSFEELKTIKLNLLKDLEENLIISEIQ